MTDLVEVLVPIFSCFIALAVFAAVVFRIRSRRGVYVPDEIFVDEEVKQKEYIPLSFKSPTKQPLNVTLLIEGAVHLATPTSGAPKKSSASPATASPATQPEARAKTVPVPKLSKSDALSTSTSYSRGTLSNTSATSATTTDDDDDDRVKRGGNKPQPNTTSSLPAYYPPPSYATLGPKQEFLI